MENENDPLWDMKAESIHGLSLQHIVTHGQSVKEVADQLDRAFHGSRVFASSSFDARWMKMLFAEAGRVMDFDLYDLDAHHLNLEKWLGKFR